MKLEPLIDELTKLSEAIEKIDDERRFSDIWGAHSAAPIRPIDISGLIERLIEKISDVNWDQSDPDKVEYLNAQTNDISIGLSGTVPHLYSQPEAHQALLSLVLTLESIVAGQISDSELKGTLALPVGLYKQVRLAKDRMEQSALAINEIDKKLEQIQNAYNAAENFPTTQKDLEDALKELERTKKAALANELAAKASADEAQSRKVELDQVVSQAESVLAKVNEAYRAATTQGLAQAFSAREKSLTQSLQLWVVLLIIALVFASLIGQDRFPSIVSSLSVNPQWGIVGLNIAVAALSMAPAVWFAWMATKQIGQRFRLAEDYGYKAALATAYEGYRNEAARLDPVFEAQLFATALGRLDEIPLRLVEPDAPGSPMHELFKSQEFKSAVDLVPGFKDRIASVFKRLPIATSRSAPPPETHTAI